MDIVDQFRKLGLFGMSIPRQHGGLGLTTVQEMSLLLDLTYTNACFRSRIGTNNSIGSMGIVFDERRNREPNNILTGKRGRAGLIHGLNHHQIHKVANGHHADDEYRSKQKAGRHNITTPPNRTNRINVTYEYGGEREWMIRLAIRKSKTK